MPEADTGSDLDQLRVFRRGERAPLDAEPVSRAPHERRVADRLGRGDQEQSLGCLRQFTRAQEIVILELAREDSSVASRLVIERSKYFSSTST